MNYKKILTLVLCLLLAIVIIGVIFSRVSKCKLPVGIGAMSTFPGQKIQINAGGVVYKKQINSFYQISEDNKKLLLKNICIDSDFVMIRIKSNEADTSFLLNKISVKNVFFDEMNDHINLYFEYRKNYSGPDQLRWE